MQFCVRRGCEARRQQWGGQGRRQSLHNQTDPERGNARARGQAETDTDCLLSCFQSDGINGIWLRSVFFFFTSVLKRLTERDSGCELIGLQLHAHNGPIYCMFLANCISDLSVLKLWIFFSPHSVVIIDTALIILMLLSQILRVLLSCFSGVRVLGVSLKSSTVRGAQRHHDIWIQGEHNGTVLLSKTAPKHMSSHVQSPGRRALIVLRWIFMWREISFFLFFFFKLTFNGPPSGMDFWSDLIGVCPCEILWEHFYSFRKIILSNFTAISLLVAFLLDDF